jgi:hypothetical protein
MNIYTPIAPTYLYIKQHSVTKLKYFGKTTSADPYKYNGSGIKWKNHIKKHGKEFVETIWVSDLYTDTSIVEIALHFSKENNIVESEQWANLIPENGMDGAPCNSGKTLSLEHRKKISVSNKGKPAANKGKPSPNKGSIMSNKQKIDISIRRINSPRITCPHCGKIGENNAMKHWHFDKCKFKLHQ